MGLTAVQWGRVEPEDFNERVRRDSYHSPMYWLVGVAGGILGAVAFENGYFLLLSGVSLIATGVAAIRWGMGAHADIGVTGSGGAAGIDHELENMTPEQRVDDANMTGGLLILLGIALLVTMAYFAWR